MWVFCGGMFRSGSTVQYQIASHLVESACRGHRLPFGESPDFAAESPRLRVAAEAEYRVCKSHGVSEAMRSQVERGRGVVLTVHRDIRDVVVSAMRKNGWSFRRLWKAGKLSRWTRRFEEWAALPGALVSRYDSLSVDLAGEVRRIAGHLGLDVGDAKRREIAMLYAIERQRERADAFRAGRGEARMKYDPHTLLHHNHIASGATGDYRNVLQAAEIRAIEDECGEWMATWGYEPDRPSLTLKQRLIGLTYRRSA